MLWCIKFQVSKMLKYAITLLDHTSLLIGITWFEIYDKYILLMLNNLLLNKLLNI
jgi:hypothetical protein